MTDTIPTVRLRNGREEAKALVNITMFSLKNLLDSHPILFYEFVTLCRDRTRKPLGGCGSDLVQRNLASKREDGTYSVHDSIRNIVVSAATGEGLELGLQNPIAQAEAVDAN